MASLTRTYSTRKLLGQVYTPPPIVHKILDAVGLNSPAFVGKTLLDPACGDGRFLTEVVRRIIKYSSPEQVYTNLTMVHGWDIDASALLLCREALDEEVKGLGINVDWNLEQLDALKQYTSQRYFDFIVGNPPYIRIQHLPETQRAFLQATYRFCQSGSTDTYVAFFELADRLLAPEGLCGFITPNSFFFSETARPLRQYFQTNQNLRLITNYSSVRVFDKTGTYAAITIFGKRSAKHFRYELSNARFEYSHRIIPFQEIQQQDLWQLSVHPPGQQGGIRLGDICRISVGITTLSDKLYLFSKQERVEEGVVRAVSKTGTVVLLEEALLKPIIKASRMKNSNDPITEYILFPYQKNGEGKNVILPEEMLREKFPLAYSYLLSQKTALNQRDNGKPNPVAWYAYGRAQSLDSAFGKKIIFSPMNRTPNFLLSENEEATLYSGYFIKYDGSYEELLTQLNSPAMADYMAIAGRDFRGGWKGYSKKIVENFRIQPTYAW
jgi:adenine-specific DNA-methyltransferase